MKELLNSGTRIALAGISLAALYDILFIGKKTDPGSAARGLLQVGFRGYGALVARGTGQKPPAGY